MFIFTCLWGMIAAVSVTRLERLEEARIFVNLNYNLPFEESKLTKETGYLDNGWTLPGTYPKLNNKAFWPNKVHSGKYQAPSGTKEICFQKETLKNYTETCYIHSVTSFWFGKSVNLSRRIITTADTYKVSLITPNIAIKAHTLTDDPSISQLLTPYHLPPSPWKVFSRLSSTLKIQSALTGGFSGFYWYKPMYWAVYYIGYRIILTEGNTFSKPFRITYLYPVSQSNQLEGIFGFQDSTAPNLEFIPPDRFEFYPIHRGLNILPSANLPPLD
ncbi:hypothetical protein DSO57_1021571 [Entomophthora muscae]|uniref:Uncharacterized protein n=1 Tax=Entomophthora muscae TaxID=34485 RepID=A0ACC2SSK8_9FUNG|nr:hypothetical protein DSO57_1021571 [Entomophthora muscae]